MATRILDLRDDVITTTSNKSAIVGETMFVCGRLVKIISAECIGYHMSAFNKGERMYDHKILYIEEKYNES